MTRQQFRATVRANPYWAPGGAGDRIMGPCKRGHCARLRGSNIKTVSKYKAHQGAQERARRLRRMGLAWP